MPASASGRGGKRPTTYAYNAKTLGIRKPRISSENRIVKALVESTLESGLASPDAVRLALGVYKEIDILARDELGNVLSPTALRDIRTYCRAILRAGVTFDAREIAAEAVATWRSMGEELKKLHEEWDRESVSRRLKSRAVRQEAAAKQRVLRGEPDDETHATEIEALYGEGAQDEMQQLDREVNG